MQNLLKLLPLKVLINLVFDLLKYIVAKTKNTTDDEIVQALYDMYCIIEPVIPQKALEEHIKNKK